MTDQLAFDYRASDPDTSREAAIYNMPNRSGDQQKVLVALMCAGERGYTDFELAAATGIAQTSIGCRRLSLVRDGLVAPRMVIGTNGLQQDRRPSPSGTPSLLGVSAGRREGRDVSEHVTHVELNSRGRFYWWCEASDCLHTKGPPSYRFETEALDDARAHEEANP